MFVPARAMCPRCLKMKQVVRFQLIDGTILLSIVIHSKHRETLEACPGSERRVVTPNEVDYESYFEAA